MRQADQGGAGIDGIDHRLGIDGDPIAGRDQLQLMLPAQQVDDALQDVQIGGEVEYIADDLSAIRQCPDSRQGQLEQVDGG
jgi:hypothetical protein